MTQAAGVSETLYFCSLFPAHWKPSSLPSAVLWIKQRGSLDHTWRLSIKRELGRNEQLSSGSSSKLWELEGQEGGGFHPQSKH